ncbi:GNAT family N-acetyltransferase [Geosporobacter ferrireducens]|uniref:GNAT family N-acetyltransferase n=1 Tax=Geosporobacter ferrireducens TaxID=1424294 RepID=A0A1D8GNK8_9FIRM|nr:GNAT family N-acetyltransferase [Geosporobacter ferrireducens]AOT72473.1 GNAT family N-acetyltransferase [Geosporobacter ferrireducens]MTI56263.1 GNAT family N-acetyltransferase [Geosporobacter ferrireducens]
MSCVAIRDCEDKDIKAVIGLLHELKTVANIDNDFPVGDLVKIFEELKMKPEIYLNLVAEIDEKIVGFISIIFYKTLFHKGGTALINELIIRSSYRGKGIGKLLIESAKEEAIKRGMDELEVGTEITNKEAQCFYKKCGFNEEYVLLGMEF